MLNILNVSRIPKGNPKVLLNWNRFLVAAKNQIDYSITRYNTSKLITASSIQFIKSILDKMSEPYFLKGGDKYLIYNRYILPESYTYSRVFDPIIVNIKNKVFLSSSTDETLLPTNGLTGVNGYLSVDNDWSVWKKNYTMKTFAHDSLELNLNFQGGVPKFRTGDPSYSIIGIDVASLMLQYIAIYKDLVDIWIINVMSSLFSDDPKDIKELAFLASNMYIGEGVVATALTDLKEVIDRVKNRSYYVRDFLDTTFFPGSRSLRDVIIDYNEMRSLDYGNRYLGYYMLKNIDLINIMSNALTSQIDLNTNLKSFIRQDLQIINRSNYGSHIHNPLARNRIAKVVSEMELDFGE